MLQLPLAQDGLPPLLEQTVPQAPQLLMSALVGVSHPFRLSSSQSARPVSQTPISHVPLVQMAEAPWTLQSLPHAPQLSGSDVGSTQAPLQRTEGGAHSWSSTAMSTS